MASGAVPNRVDGSIFIQDRSDLSKIEHIDRFPASPSILLGMYQPVRAPASSLSGDAHRGTSEFLGPQANRVGTEQPSRTARFGSNIMCSEHKIKSVRSSNLDWTPPRPTQARRVQLRPIFDERRCAINLNRRDERAIRAPAIQPTRPHDIHSQLTDRPHQTRTGQGGRHTGMADAGVTGGGQPPPPLNGPDRGRPPEQRSGLSTDGTN